MGYSINENYKKSLIGKTCTLCGKGTIFINNRIVHGSSTSKLEMDIHEVPRCNKCGKLLTIWVDMSTGKIVSMEENKYFK